MPSIRVAAMICATACGGGVLDTLGEQSQSFDVAEHIQVVTETGRVELIVGGDDAIDVTFLAGAKNETWQDRVDGDTLVIESVCTDGEVGCAGAFLITLPASTDATIQTTDGSVALGDGLTGHYALTTVSGGVSGQGLGPASLDVLTNGLFDVDFAEAPSSVDVDGGKEDLTLTVPAGAYALSLDAVGTITVDDAIDDDASGPPVTMQTTADLTLRAR